MNERAISLLEQMLAEQKKQTGLLEQIAERARPVKILYRQAAAAAPWWIVPIFP